MVKADEKIDYEGIKGKFTNFEELQKRVEVLQRILDEHASILRQNNLVKIKRIEAPYFDDDVVYRELEDEVTSAIPPKQP